MATWEVMDYYYYRRRMACNFPMHRFPPHTHTKVKKNSKLWREGKKSQNLIKPLAVAKTFQENASMYD